MFQKLVQENLRKKSNNSIEIQKEHQKGLNLLNTKIQIANDSYNLVDSNIKRLNEIIDIVQKEMQNIDNIKFSLKNSTNLIDKNFEELIESNFLSNILN